jgi:hypothetical protein
MASPVACTWLTFVCAETACTVPAASVNKNGPEGPFFIQGAVTTQAVTPFAFSTYSSIWLKFRYL